MRVASRAYPGKGEKREMNFYVTFLQDGYIRHAQVDGKDEEEALKHLRVTYKRVKVIVKVEDITQIIINKAKYGF